jgi:hypothetical protein
MASEDLKMSKQGTAGKKKHRTLIIPQKVEIIRRLEGGKSCSVVMASCNTGLSTVCDTKKQKNHS